MRIWRFIGQRGLPVGWHQSVGISRPPSYGAERERVPFKSRRVAGRTESRCSLSKCFRQLTTKRTRLSLCANFLVGSTWPTWAKQVQSSPSLQIKIAETNCLLPLSKLSCRGTSFSRASQVLIRMRESVEWRSGSGRPLDLFRSFKKRKNFKKKCSFQADKIRKSLIQHVHASV